MKLNIAQNLKKYRREREITQEALAKELGISAQSVSKWERGEGYPDIELLPNLANHLNITIDELLGNDSAARQEDIRLFWQKFWSSDSRFEGENYFDCRIRIAEEYWRKYPNEYSIACALLQEICAYRKKLEENRPLLNEIVEKIMSDCMEAMHRETALYNICLVCKEDEYAKWSELCASEYRLCREEILEQRFLAKEEIDKAMLRRSLNNLKHFTYLLAKFMPNHLSPEQVAAEIRKNRQILAVTADENGTIPQAWLPCDSYCDFYLAAASFGMGKKEKGYELLERSLNSYETWQKIPGETILEFGCKDLFGGIFTRKKITGGTVFLPDENQTPADDVSYFILRTSMDHAFHILDPDTDWVWNCGIAWEWLSDVRKEERFRKLVERAKELCPFD